MTNILQDRSEYLKDIHLPIPKLAYVLERTGENLVLNTGSNDKARSFLIQMTQTAWLFLKQLKTLDTANRLEYLIATDIEYRQAFLDYVCSFIYDIYYGGLDPLLTPSERLRLLDGMTPKTRSFVEGSLLNVGTFYRFEYKYRKGY